MYSNDDDDESTHFRPDAWKVAWEAIHDVLAPSCVVKAAAEALVWNEFLQQAMGWMLLTQIGILLGSFGQLMSLSTCLLSWAIFMLEAFLKYARRWAHNHFFMDVPCAYVSIHEAGHDSLAFFGISLLTAVVLEVALYVPFIVSVFNFWHQNRSCLSESFEKDNPDVCPTGTRLLTVFLFLCVGSTIIHLVCSIVTSYTFHSAIGVGVVFQEKKLKLKQRLSWHGNYRHACRCNEKGCEARKMGNTPRSDSDRILCLTWWVHMARHCHLSAVVASAQSGNCGLPGHWFESVAQLKRIVEECVQSGTGNHDFNSDGPMWVSLEMALRALVSLAKQRREEPSREILDQGGFNLLVQVVRDGEFSSCRALAAAAIAVLATQTETIRNAQIDLAIAVVPLKRLVRSKEHELKEIALGALLNIVLNDDQIVGVIAKIHSSDGIVVGAASRGSFMSVLMEQAHLGPTTRCQELATGLLARLSTNSSQARAALLEPDKGKLVGLQLLIELLQHGLTTELKSSAAGALAELAYKDGKAIGKGPYGESCINALVKELGSGSRIAYAAARALCNLGMRGDENKQRIVAADGVMRLVEVLKDEDFSQNANFGSKKDTVAYLRLQIEMQDREQAQGEAAKALWMLAYNNPENQELIANANAIPHLANVLLVSKCKVHMQVVAALTTIAWNNKRNQALIGREGCVIFPRLVQILRNVDDEKMEEVLLEKVALAIRCFAEGSEANRAALLKAGAREQLEDIIQRKDRTYKRDRAIARAKAAIEMLDRKEA